VVSGLQNILRQVAELQKGDRTGFTYRVKGRLSSRGLAIPFETRGEFSFPLGGEKSGT